MSFYHSHIASAVHRTQDDVHAQTVTFVARDGAAGLNGDEGGSYPGVRAKVGPASDGIKQDDYTEATDRTREIGLYVIQTLDEQTITLPIAIGATFIVSEGGEWVIEEVVQRNPSGDNEYMILRCIQPKIRNLVMRGARERE